MNTQSPVVGRESDAGDRTLHPAPENREHVE
jgi:hypothetical protein